MYNLEQSIFTFRTEGIDLANPRLVIQYKNPETKDFKQIVVEKGSEMATKFKLDQYFDLVEKFAANVELTELIEQSEEQSIQFVNETK